MGDAPTHEGWVGDVTGTPDAIEYICVADPDRPGSGRSARWMKWGEAAAEVYSVQATADRPTV